MEIQILILSRYVFIGLVDVREIKAASMVILAFLHSSKKYMSHMSSPFCSNLDVIFCTIIMSEKSPIGV